MEKSNQVQQDSNLSIYERVRCVPNEAKKEIEAGRLKGKHDINSEDSLIRNPTAKTGEVLQADANLIATYNALKQVNAEVKALEKTQTSLEDDLKMAMGEAETLVSPTGEVMALWKNTKPTMKFNAKAFQQDDPAGYAKYMEPTASTRRFSVK